MRGQKICPNCKTATGPRAFRCKSCDTLFVIKGVTVDRPPITAGYKKVEDEEDVILFQLSDFFVPVDNYSEDDVNIRCYDGKAICFVSKDGEHRLRYATTYMGIDLTNSHGRFFSLLKRVRQGDKVGWELVSRHKREQSALKYYDRVVLKGLEPLKTRKERRREKRKAGKK